MLYLDHNATTPLDPRVLEAMMPYLTEQYGNASSTHKFGLTAKDAVTRATQQLADLLNAQPNELVFTSGATESINLALKGVAEAYADRGHHIITVATEHKAVLDVCAYLETIGIAVTYLPVQPDGRLDPDVVEAAFTDQTILLAVMLANNETGVLQDLRPLAELAHAHEALLFTDATQAVGKIPVDVDALDVDLLALSAHKFYGPKGVGALYTRQCRGQRTKLTAQMHGGGHQRGFRSGTLNVPGIVGLGAAAHWAKTELDDNNQKLVSLRDTLEASLLEIPGSILNGHPTLRLPNITNISFPGLEADTWVAAQTEIMAATGSACTAAIIEPSHVLQAMGRSNEEAFGALRFGVSHTQTVEEIAQVAEAIMLSLQTLNLLANP
ncbi:MAG TPA: IscS subfamily cysteine desulfurase [Cytophagales bacterium]|nr:IscS subfamily cysteine desulfurase [Cytophagales bacterium]